MPFFGVLGRNQETESGASPFGFCGQETLRSDHPLARCGISRPRTPFQVRPSLYRPLCLSSAFWDRTKKPSLGRHRLAFEGNKLRDQKESDHPVARCGLSRPRTPFQVRSSLSRRLCLYLAFWDGTKKSSLGRHRSAFVGKKLGDRTTQKLDVNFRGLGPRSKSGRPFLGHYAFLRRFGMETRNRV